MCEQSQHLYSVYLLYRYKSTNTDAAQDRCDSTISALDHTRIGWGYFGGGIAAGLLLETLIAGLVYILVNRKKKGKTVEEMSGVAESQKLHNGDGTNGLAVSQTNAQAGELGGGALGVTLSVTPAVSGGELATLSHC